MLYIIKYVGNLCDRSLSKTSTTDSKDSVNLNEPTQVGSIFTPRWTYTGRGRGDNFGS